MTMSRTQASAVNVDWQEREPPTEWDKLPAWKKRRQRRLIIHLFGAYQAYNRSPATSENPPSLVNCDCSPTSAESASTGRDEWAWRFTASGRPVIPRSTSGANSESSSNRARVGVDAPMTDHELEALDALVKLGIEDVEEAAELARQGGDAHTAVFGALERGETRRRNVAALLERGKISQALRLATCGRRSVQLQCTCCGSEDNYVPTSCDLVLCDDCAEKKKGQVIGKYEDAVMRMESPIVVTVTERHFTSGVEGRETVMEHLNDLRNRTIPFEGATERWSAAESVRTTGERYRQPVERVQKSWSWWEGATVDDIEDNHTQWKVKLQEQGEHDLVRRLQREYVEYEWEDITGVHRGKNIPWDELVEGGLYGIDVKQIGPGRYNVHAHLLLDAAYIPQAALSAVWEDVTGEAYVVDVRAIYGRQERQNVAEALAEVTGYATKPPEFENLDDELDFLQATKGCPMVHPIGSLHGNANTDAGMLFCGDCGVSPQSWEYLGQVNERRDTAERGWETDRGKDPPD